jgi:diguanylate cyclase (GGDEF)-like protein
MRRSRDFRIGSRLRAAMVVLRRCAIAERCKRLWTAAWRGSRNLIMGPGTDDRGGAASHSQLRRSLGATSKILQTQTERALRLLNDVRIGSRPGAASLSQLRRSLGATSKILQTQTERALRLLNDVRIGSRLGAAFCLLLGGTVALIWFTQAQLDRTGAVARALIARELRDVTLVHEAQSAAQASAGLLNSLILLDQPAQRRPVDLRLNADIARQNRALRALAVTARGPQTFKLIHDVERTRNAFNKRLVAVALAVETRGPSAGARELMTSGTGTALHAFVGALDKLATLETSQAVRSVARLQHLQELGQRRILTFGIIALTIAFALAIIIARSITVPLFDITTVAGEIAAGRFDGTLPVTRSDEVGDLAKALSCMRADIAAREFYIQNLAFVDPLTQLPNSTAFGAELERALEKHGNHGTLAIALLGLDRFRQVNDSLGHAAGDLVLTQVATRLQALAGAHQFPLARFGSDEFALLMADCGRERAMEIARSVIQALEEPLTVQGQAIDVAGTLGIALAPDHGRDRQSLLSRADLALHAAKKSRSNIQIFEPRMQGNSDQGLTLLSELRTALDRDQFQLVFQPKVDLRTECCSSAEALLRWRHPERGLVSPAEFIPFAEQTGFIIRLTEWVIEHACAQLAIWNGAGKALPLSINISARDIAGAGLAGFVARQLKRHGLPPGELCVEITESAVMEDVSKARKALEALRRMGLYLSIDDYGTGYASLAYLRAFAVHEIKIDQSFVRGLASSAGDEIIVRSTVELAHNLRLKVVAEGVESEAALARLALLGCDQAQGYYFSKPLSADEFALWREEQFSSENLPYRFFTQRRLRSPRSKV